MNIKEQLTKLLENKNFLIKVSVISVVLIGIVTYTLIFPKFGSKEKTYLISAPISYEIILKEDADYNKAIKFLKEITSEAVSSDILKAIDNVKKTSYIKYQVNTSDNETINKYIKTVDLEHDISKTEYLERSLSTESNMKDPLNKAKIQWNTLDRTITQDEDNNLDIIRTSYARNYHSYIRINDLEDSFDSFISFFNKDNSANAKFLNYENLVEVINNTQVTTHIFNFTTEQSISLFNYIVPIAQAEDCILVDNPTLKISLNEAGELIYMKIPTCFGFYDEVTILETIEQPSKWSIWDEYKFVQLKAAYPEYSKDLDSLKFKIEGADIPPAWTFVEEEALILLKSSYPEYAKDLDNLKKAINKFDTKESWVAVISGECIDEHKIFYSKNLEHGIFISRNEKATKEGRTMFGSMEPPKISTEYIQEQLIPADYIPKDDQIFKIEKSITQLGTNYKLIWRPIEEGTSWSVDVLGYIPEVIREITISNNGDVIRIAPEEHRFMSIDEIIFEYSSNISPTELTSDTIPFYCNWD